MKADTLNRDLHKTSDGSLICRENLRERFARNYISFEILYHSLPLQPIKSMADIKQKIGRVITNKISRLKSGENADGSMLLMPLLCRGRIVVQLSHERSHDENR